jgi:hypothetical protein
VNPLEIIKDKATDMWRSLTEEEQKETPQAVMNRAMRRAQRRSQRMHGAGYTRPMRKGRGE